MIKKEKAINLNVHIHPSSKTQKIECYEDKIEIYLKENPEKNKANKALLKLLKDTFHTQITIKRGLSSRYKVVSIIGKEKKDVEKTLKELY